MCHHEWRAGSGQEMAASPCCRPDFEMTAVTVAAGNLAGPDGTFGPIVQVRHFCRFPLKILQSVQDATSPPSCYL